MIVSPKGRQILLTIYLRCLTPTIQTSSSPWKKILTTSWTPLSSTKRQTSPPKFIKNQASYKYIGNRPSQKGGSATLFLVPYIEQNELERRSQSHQTIIRKAGYPAKLVNEVIHDFENPKSDEKIIPVHWFDERPKLGICLPFCSHVTL